MGKRAYPLARVYGLLEPGPVLLLTTTRKGRDNVMTLSWHTMMEFEPPLVGCVVSGRDFSFEALRATRQCVLNMPTRDMAAQVVAGEPLKLRSKMKQKPLRATASGAAGARTDGGRAPP